jgi:hypothetical protein
MNIARAWPALGPSAKETSTTTARALKKESNTRAPPGAGSDEALWGRGAKRDLTGEKGHLPSECHYVRFALAM